MGYFTNERQNAISENGELKKYSLRDFFLVYFDNYMAQADSAKLYYSKPIS